MSGFTAKQKVANLMAAEPAAAGKYCGSVPKRIGKPWRVALQIAILSKYKGPANYLNFGMNCIERHRR